MTDQVGVRFGIAAGLLFALTGLVVAGGLPGAYGVALLLVATTVLAAALDAPHALALGLSGFGVLAEGAVADLGLSGWAFATGFAVNTLGVLTVRPLDLLRLAAFVVAAAAARGRGGTP